MFTTPVLTPTFGIIKWTKQELEQMDVKTRKILSRNSSFHVNSDINRLYTRRDKGGRGLNSITDVYIARIILISRHLIEKSPTDKYLNLLQSNLYKKTTLGTTQKWSFWKGGHLIKNLHQVTTNQIWSFLAGFSFFPKMNVL